MCVVSMVTDHYIDKWPRQRLPYTHPYPGGSYPNQPWTNPTIPAEQQPIDLEQLNKILQPKLAPPTQEDILQFRNDMAEFKLLLERAREYDKRNNEPNCELDSKKAAIRALAEHFGVKVDFL